MQSRHFWGLLWSAPDNGALARGEIKLLQARFVAPNDWLGEKVVIFGD